MISIGVDIIYEYSHLIFIELDLRPIYLDYNGSTPLDPRVLELMMPILKSGIGNASASHIFGQSQAQRIEEAREQVSSLVGGRSSQTIFTSGATESNNLVLFGILQQASGSRKKILISAVEHASVCETANWIAELGLARVVEIPVSPGGCVEPVDLESMIDANTLLVSVMAANSETGVLNPIRRIADIAHEVGAYLHCDVTQVVAREDFELELSGADFISFSSHKIYGPTGVGALVGTHNSLRKLTPIIHGGGHERGLRSGSSNTAGIVGFGAAADIALQERFAESSSNRFLRDRLVKRLVSRIPGATENGDTTKRLSNTTNIRFRGADADAVLTNMYPVAASNGSACSSGIIEPSRVLLNMGLSHSAASESIRFSLGRYTTKKEIDSASIKIAESVDYVRAMSKVAV